MNALVQPWRDAYRAYDPSCFRDDLVRLPDLPHLVAALDQSVLRPSPRSLSVPDIHIGQDVVQARLPKQPKYSQLRSLPKLLEIPNLSSSQSWCADFRWRPQKIASQLESAMSPEAEVKATKTDEHRLLPSIQSCLIALLVGHESAAFSWNISSNSFRTATNDARSGQSYTMASRDLLEEFMNHGTCFRRLHFAQDLLLSKAREFPSVLVQVAVFLRDFLESCADHASKLAMSSNVGSILYLWQQSVQREAALNLLDSLLELGVSGSIETQVRHLSGTKLLDTLEREIRNQVSVRNIEDQVVRDLFVHLTQPLFAEIASRTGLGPPTNSNSFLRPNSNQEFTADSRPTIISQGQGQIVLEIEEGIAFLTRNTDQEISSKLEKMRSLHMEFTLFDNEIEALELRVREWSESIRSGQPSVDSLGKDLPRATGDLKHGQVPRALNSKQAISNEIQSSVELIEKEEVFDIGTTSKLEARLQRHSREAGCLDFDQFIRICLHLPLQIQASFIRTAVFNVLSHKLQLREHLDLLRQIYLFGNGEYTVKLTHTLFSSDNSSIGLHNRTGYWPPEASTVSFATRAILRESVHTSYLLHQDNQLAERELLGHLGIIMSQEEETQEIPRESLDALSFLHFNFRAPAPLDLVITPRSLQLYDTINQFLLLLLRMKNVVDRLIAHSRNFRTMQRVSMVPERFRIQATNFVQSFTAHIFETVIGVHCGNFEKTLMRKDISITLLKDAHESMLDHIAHCCFLGKKMVEIQLMLRVIFNSILEFSFLPSHIRDADHDGVEKLYAVFSLNVRKLIAVMVGAEATKSDSFATGISARFLMNDFWAAR